jgi:hypothetical protein
MLNVKVYNDEWRTLVTSHYYYDTTIPYIHILCIEVFGSIALVLGSRMHPEKVLQQIPSTYIFWYFCLYYSPVDDMWIPMSLHLARIGIKSASLLLESTDYIFEPLTAVLELLYILLSVLFRCEYPHILLIHLFFLSEALYTFAYNLYIGTQNYFDEYVFPRVSSGIEFQDVVVYWPVEEKEIGAIAGCALVGKSGTGFGIELGYWRRQNAKVRLRKEKVSQSVI